MDFSKVLDRKIASNMTFILPEGNDTTSTVQGVIMYPQLSKFTLPSFESYQQYMVKDDVFKRMTIMYNGTHIYKWMSVLLSVKNEDSCNIICQSIN